MFDVATDKWLFYKFARRHDVRTPWSSLVTRDASFDSLIANLTYPVIIKPTIGFGGWGIERCDSEKELLSALARHEKDSPGTPRMVQRYCEGADVDISVLCKDGRILAFTIQRMLVRSSTNVFAYGQIIEFIPHADVLAAATKLLAALKWTGVAHIDCKWNERDGASILEINPRFWGTLLGSTAVGVNFPYLAFLSARRTPFPCPEYHKTVFARLSVKEWLLWPFGKRPFPGLKTEHTNLRYVLDDPRVTLASILKLS
jgi:predicted ATP-grasp superfamily ATP-dependent carboligase